MTDAEIVDLIQEIRSRNNINWMGILKIALRYAPEETKVLLASVYMEDAAVSDLVKLLCFPSTRVD
jgi:hypothetical protein